MSSVHLADLQRPLARSCRGRPCACPRRGRGRTRARGRLGRVARRLRRCEHVGEQARCRPRAPSRGSSRRRRRPARRPRRRAPRRSSSASVILCSLLRERALLRAGRLVELGAERVERLADLLRGGRDALELARGELAVLAGRGLADELADLLRVLGRDRAGELGEDARAERAHLLERRQPCSSAQFESPRAQKSSSSSKFRVLARGEVVAPPLQPVLERGERLVAVDVDPLRLGLDLVLEVVQVGLRASRCRRP